ncbi:hypothetical protein P171DRAFT_523545 [Karstenula rhodostoma CBS 690.94]|uniref:Uncharacterized protein n=1 Tax=Karstenula rhodostoma CBS 690.94 TaxID=1392251 RepID=A0A9P4PAS3_9PLEO|nr:hypothetical protein P171DRAFT_523545 [Karstenula rhodostoma CBS 690.94]
MSSSTYDPTETFQKACKTIIDDLPETFTVNTKYHLHDNLYGFNDLGKIIAIEHPDIDKEWSCMVKMEYIYLGNADVYIGYKINPRELFREALLKEYTKFKIQPSEAEITAEKLSMMDKTEIVVKVGEFRLRFVYKGPNMNPKLSKEKYDGGDAYFWGSSRDNPDPKKYFYAMRMYYY